MGSPGEFYLVKFIQRGPTNIWHERLLVSAHPHQRRNYILTPDGDHREEPASVGGPEVVGVSLLDGQGATPQGMREAAFYRFRALPTAQKIWEAARAARQIGYPVPASPVQLQLGIGNLLGATPGPLGILDPCIVPPPPVALATGAPARGALPGLPLALGGHPVAPAAAGLPAPVPDVGTAPAAAAASIAATPVAAPAPTTIPSTPRGALQLMAAGGPGDPRVLRVLCNSLGVRERDFGEAVQAFSETPVADWPLEGPRTLLWVLNFMSKVTGGALGWHNKWLSLMSLGDDHDASRLHETLCRILDLGVTFDQLKVTELASFELAARQLQFLEAQVHEVAAAWPMHKAAAAWPTAPWRKSAASSSTAAWPTETSFLESGLSKADLCIAPKLLEYVAERHNAREEGALRAP